jgi:transcriptional regulator with XRE-family HTH domain
MEAQWFAGRLRELRQAAGLTQAELAERAGMAKDGIAHLEQGRRAPAWESVIALCKALQVRCDAFLIAPQDNTPRGRGRPGKDEEQTAKRNRTSKRKKG